MCRAVTIFLLFVFFHVSAQEKASMQFYKDKIFLYQKIGIDSSLVYVNKIFSSEKDSDQAFAYTAKRYLLAVARRNYDDKSYLSKIKFYLNKIPETEENYTVLSQIYNILGNTDKINQKPIEALKEFIKADFFAQKNSDVRQHIKIAGNIASIKLDLKQTDEAITETRKVLKLLKENKNLYEQENFEIIYNNIFSNLGHLYSDKFIADTDRNRKYADSASQNFHHLLQITKDKKLIAVTYLKLGTLYNKKKDYVKASNYYQRSLDIYQSLKLKNEMLNVKYNIGTNYYDLKEYEKSKHIFLKLSHLMEKDSLKNTDYIFTQDYLAKIYLKEGKSDSVEYFNNKFIELYKQNSEIEKENIATLYKNINDKNLHDEIDRNSSVLKSRLFLIMALVILSIGIAGYLVYQLRKKKKIEKRLNEILLSVKNDTLPAAHAHKNNFTISNEKEREIINKLFELEEKKLYLKKDYNQAYVAKKLGTNTTYLSQAVNNYAKKSFSEYTNELRINYILRELSENKKIRSYTTQALADIVGYKNGISFARTFKQKTGVTPFQYIEKLNKDIPDTNIH